MIVSKLEQISNFIVNMPYDSLAFFSAEIIGSLNKQEFFYNPQGANCYFQYLLGFETENKMNLLIHKTTDNQIKKILFCKDSTSKLDNFSYIYKSLKYWRDFYKDFVCKQLSEFYEIFYNLGLNSKIIFFPGWSRKESPEFWLELLTKWSIDSNVKLPAKKLISYKKILDKSRMLKTSHELSNMSKASKITEEAFKDILINWTSFVYELDVSARLKSAFFKDKFSFPAYDPIVATDSNGLSLHHNGNLTKIKNKNMVIIDAAASYRGYAVDVTRTYIIGENVPIECIEIYKTVLFCQENILKQLKPNLTFINLQKLTCNLLLSKMKELSILDKLPILKTISNNDFIKIVFPHKVGHWIGLEVHDVGTYHDTIIPESSTLTIEPGLYFPEDSRLFGPYAGICVRIEDTVVVTKDGIINLTDNIPKNFNFYNK